MDNLYHWIQGTQLIHRTIKNCKQARYIMHVPIHQTQTQLLTPNLGRIGAVSVFDNHILQGDPSPLVKREPRLGVRGGAGEVRSPVSKGYSPGYWGYHSPML